MRRSDREIGTFDEITDVVERCGCVRIAMVDQGMPYIVPMNFGFESEGGSLVLYMHSAKQGRKIDILKENPDVCFEMDIPAGVVEGDAACSWTQSYESVVGSGTVEFLETPEEKKTGLTAIVKHYGFGGTPDYPDAMLEKTCVMRVNVSELSGKRNPEAGKERKEEQ